MTETGADTKFVSAPVFGCLCNQMSPYGRTIGICLTEIVRRVILVMVPQMLVYLARAVPKMKTEIQSNKEKDKKC